MQIQIEKLVAKNGEPTLKVNEYFVHSKYNPRREAEQLVDQQYTPHYTHVLFGYGCGHVVEAFVKRRSFQEKLIVIDPLFDDDLISFDHSIQNVYAYKSDVVPFLLHYLNEIAQDSRVSFKVICMPNYDKIFPDLYKEVLFKVKERQYKNRTNDYTLMRYSRDWQKNFMHNLKYLTNDSNIAQLEKKYNCPVIVASGGPSLTKQLPFLKQYRDKIIIVASGSTVNSLIKNNIEPDYVVTIDGGEPNYNHFSQLKLQHAKIIYGLQNHYKVRESFEQQGFVIGAHSFKKQNCYLRKYGVDLPILEAGGSAAHSAFMVAQYITTGPVALIGQDLAYTNNMTHAANNLGASTVDEQFKIQNEAFETQGYYGEPVWTNPSFYSMKLDFEALILEYKPTIPFYNCTEGGIHIEAFQMMAFESFLKQYAVQPIQITNVNNEYEPLLQNTTILLGRLRRDIDTLEKLVQDALKLLHKVGELKTFPVPLVTKIDKIERKIKRQLDNIPMESLTSAITIEILQNYLPQENESNEQTFNRTFAQMNSLYSKLQEAINIVRENLKAITEGEELINE